MDKSHLATLASYNQVFYISLEPRTVTAYCQWEGNFRWAYLLQDWNCVVLLQLWFLELVIEAECMAVIGLKSFLFQIRLLIIYCVYISVVGRGRVMSRCLCGDQFTLATTWVLGVKLQTQTIGNGRQRLHPWSLFTSAFLFCF